MLNPSELKRIALSKREEISYKKESKVSEFNEATVISYSVTLEKHVIEFAEKGHLAVDYQFTDQHSIALIYAVAKYFKQAHPLLMVIVFEGEKKIRVTWDGNNHI
jgi:hypothetical protein